MRNDTPNKATPHWSTMTSHLQGRMPHADVAQVLEDIQDAETDAEIQACFSKIEHIARTFASVVTEFRSTLPASERNKRKLIAPPIEHNQQRQRRADDWKPFQDLQEELSDVLLEHELHPSLLTTTLKDLRAFKPAAYTHYYSALNTSIVHDKLWVCRDLMNAGGVDLKTFYNQPGSVGSGFRAMVYDNVRVYLLVNQLLLHDWPMPTQQKVLQRQSATSPLVPHDLQFRVQQQARATLQESLSAHDNHDYRHNTLVQALLAKIMEDDSDSDATNATSPPQPVSYHDLLYAHVKDYVFPQLVGLSHLFLYNEIIRIKQQQSCTADSLLLLTDASRHTFLDEQIQNQVIWSFHPFLASKRMEAAFTERFKNW